MRIAYMPETTIELIDDGSIQIVQKGEQTDDHIVSFPIELAEKIANEILRLAEGAAKAGETRSG